LSAVLLFCNIDSCNKINQITGITANFGLLSVDKINDSIHAMVEMVHSSCSAAAVGVTIQT
jgi:hypothetical protein